MTTYAHQFPSPVGELYVAVDEPGTILRLEFINHRDQEWLEAGLTPPIVRDAGRCNHVERQIAEYFRGERREFNLEIDLHGSPFQNRVWRELQRIPYGETVSYRQMAERLGRPTATRAVGRANATNPIVLVVPCHRVIGADGSLTGFGGGIETKRTLLQLEGSRRELF